MKASGRVSRVVVIAVGLMVAALFWDRLVEPGCACVPQAKAFQAAMKSDLRNLVTWEEAFFADSGRWARREELDSALWSRGVTLDQYVVGDSGWSASARHERLQLPCAVVIGDVAPLSPATADGGPACEPEELPTFFQRLFGR